jgi:tetratricopeptide (TPR) repeat protein
MRFEENLDSVCILLNEDKPDSAYTVLIGLDKAVPEMTEAEMMRYEVCRVSAKNKMFVSLKDEEEAMQRAVEYYEEHGSPDEKMEACLLLGSVYRDMGDAPQALEWFDKAITYGEKGTNKTQLAKIHGQKADLFIKQRLFEDALVEVEKMESISRSLDEKSLQVNAMSIKSTIEYCMGDYQESVNTYKEASSILCNSLHDTVRAARIAASSIASYMRMERYRDAEELFDFYERHSGLFDDEGDILAGYESFYLDKGDYYAAIGDLQKSISFYNKGIMAQDVNNKCMAYYKLANVYSDMSLSDSVAKYALLACGYSQKYFEELQTNTLQQIEATYNYGRYKQESAEKALETERTRNFTYVLLSIFALSLGAISFAWTMWRQKKKREMGQVIMRLEKAKTDAYRISVERNELKAQLEEKVSMIEELSKKDETVTESNSNIMVLQKLQSEVEQLNDELSRTERSYAKLMNEGENILTTLLLKANNRVNVNEKEWNRLKDYIDEVYPRFLDNLVGAIPNINQDYMRIAMLVKLEFSTTHIASLVCRSVTAVSNARRRMYEKAHKGSTGTAELADEWIKGL